VLTIIVLFHFSRVYNDSVAAMKAAIYLANDEANQILANSQVNLRLRIVGIETAGDSFVEPGSDGTAFGTMLGWLSTSSDPNLGQRAATLRDQYGADSVLLVNAANAYCGLGYVNTGYSASSSFASYNAGCLWGGVWMHELGHNMGCYHDRISDSSVSATKPTYLGFGSCWEDTSKSDCTCYKSVMVYDCNTTVNHCTSCSSKNYLSNYHIMDSGSATGTPISSCGLQIDANHNLPVKYRKSKQPGGIIFAVSPNYAIASSCFTVTISGWSLNTLLTGDSIVSVTLAGHDVTIVNQTMNSVTVLSPIFDTAVDITGSVVVTTYTGRTTTLENAFTFRPKTFTSVSTFQDRSLGIWKNNGSISWSYAVDGSDIHLYKDGGLASDEAHATTVLLWTSTDTSDNIKLGSCEYIASNISFN